MKPISPLEIVKRTPKSNCSECGFPTCLAFGAAVIKTCENPNSCPYINLDGLDIETAINSEKDQKNQDFEFIAYLKSKVAPLDFKSIANHFGTELSIDSPETLLFNYLGQHVELSKQSILINGIDVEDPRDIILLYNYISSPGDMPLSHEWVGMESLPNSISKIKTLSTYCEDRLAKVFTLCSHEQINSFFDGLQTIPAPEDTASFSVIIHVLPMVPQYLLYWAKEPEDNFEANVKILFDRNTLHFLDIESLVFSSERLADKIIELC